MPSFTWEGDFAEAQLWLPWAQDRQRVLENIIHMRALHEGEGTGVGGKSLTRSLSIALSPTPDVFALIKINPHHIHISAYVSVDQSLAVIVSIDDYNNSDRIYPPFTSVLRSSKESNGMDIESKAQLSYGLASNHAAIYNGAVGRQRWWWTSENLPAYLIFQDDPFGVVYRGGKFSYSNALTEAGVASDDRYLENTRPLLVEWNHGVLFLVTPLMVAYIPLGTVAEGGTLVGGDFILGYVFADELTTEPAFNATATELWWPKVKGAFTDDTPELIDGYYWTRRKQMFLQEKQILAISYNEVGDPSTVAEVFFSEASPEPIVEPNRGEGESEWAYAYQYRYRSKTPTNVVSSAPDVSDLSETISRGLSDSNNFGLFYNRYYGIDAAVYLFCEPLQTCYKYVCTVAGWVGGMDSGISRSALGNRYLVARYGVDPTGPVPEIEFDNLYDPDKPGLKFVLVGPTEGITPTLPYTIKSSCVTPWIPLETRTPEEIDFDNYYDEQFQPRVDHLKIMRNIYPDDPQYQLTDEEIEALVEAAILEEWASFPIPDSTGIIWETTYEVIGEMAETDSAYGIYPLGCEGYISTPGWSTSVKYSKTITGTLTEPWNPDDGDMPNLNPPPTTFSLITSCRWPLKYPYQFGGASALTISYQEKLGKECVGYRLNRATGIVDPVYYSMTTPYETDASGASSPAWVIGEPYIQTSYISGFATGYWAHLRPDLVNAVPTQEHKDTASQSDAYSAGWKSDGSTVLTGEVKSVYEEALYVGDDLNKQELLRINKKYTINSLQTMRYDWEYTLNKTQTVSGERKLASISTTTTSIVDKQGYKIDELVYADYQAMVFQTNGWKIPKYGTEPYPMAATIALYWPSTPMDSMNNVVNYGVALGWSEETTLGNFTTTIYPDLKPLHIATFTAPVLYKEDSKDPSTPPVYSILTYIVATCSQWQMFNTRKDKFDAIADTQLNHVFNTTSGAEILSINNMALDESWQVIDTETLVFADLVGRSGTNFIPMVALGLGLTLDEPLNTE